MSITRLSGGLTPGDGSDPRTFPEIFNDVADLVEAAGSDIDDLEAKNIPAFGTATPSDGQVLTFDSAGSVFVPEDVAGSLEDLTDTSITSPVSGEVLEYDGTNWVNAAGATGGKILQVVSTTKTDTFSAGIPAGGTADVTGLSATITPNSVSSKILVLININGSSEAGGNERGSVKASIDRNGTTIGSAAGTSVAGEAFVLEVSAQNVLHLSINYLDQPATTSLLTYKVQVQQGVSSGGASVYVNRNEANTRLSTSSITLMEVAV